MPQPNSYPSWIGHTISGRYKIESLLGQGGMSAVYKATDPNLRRTVAVKLIHPHLSMDPEFVRRFEQEAAAVAQLRHQNIIQVYDFNHDGDVYYMVLEYVDGQTLQDKLQTLNQNRELMPLTDTVKIMATVSDAVAFAHEHGMIHRDLKPANVMLNKRGQPILMDFGVAKMLGTAQHTATGAIIGTAMYMSPEQARGDRPDERTDIYSLGVMLYEMITGAPPFEGESTVAILMKHVTERVPDIRNLKQDIPPAMVTVVDKALAKDRTSRYQTAAELAAALRAVDLTEAPTLFALPADSEQTLFAPADPDHTVLQPSATKAVPPAPAAPAAMPAASPAPAAPVAAPPADRQGGVPMWLIGVVAVVVLLLGGGIAALFALNGGSEATPVATATIPPTTAVQAVVLTTAPPTDTPPPATDTPPPADTPLPPTNTPPPAPTDTPPPAEPTTAPTAAVADVLPTSPAEPTATPAPRDTPTQPPPPSPPPGMVFVPAGFFQMGSNSGQPNEQPVHPVLLDGYFIDKTEVTNAAYRNCVAAGACTPAQKADAFTIPGYRDDPAFDNFPVISVDWDQARAFCQFAGKRLPTEAEWEFAARGPQNFTWPWGNSFDANLSAANSPDVQAVGSFPGGASPFGLLDMAGNVNEWVADTFSPGFYADSPPANPANTAGGDHIFRGGSFANPDGAFYTTSRRYTNPRSFSEVDVGFRCAASAPNAAPPPAVVSEFCSNFNKLKPGAPCP